MEKWLRDGLCTCLDFEVPNDMIKFILSLKTSSEFDDYVETLLNKECKEHQLFMTDCKRRLFSKALPSKKANEYGEIRQNKSPNVPVSGGPTHGKHQKVPQDSGCSSAKQHQQQQQQQQGAKKKVKYVNLYENDGKVIGQTIMIKGRRKCECQATQHKLISNCLSCGRIVCEQEGSGDCLFCGHYVSKAGEPPMVAENKRNEKNQKRLQKKTDDEGLKKTDDEGLKKALDQRDRLLEYERNSEKRTTVIDDEFDYFQENSVWLSEQEREKFERLKEEMHDRKHASRASRKIKVDFAGREVNEEEYFISEDYERGVLQELNEVDKLKKLNMHNKFDTDGVDPNIEYGRQIFHATPLGKAQTRALQMEDGLERSYNRVQDKELLEMEDMRKCLSLHQPWASLLVAGIKKHEGRVWYTGHRGRLWIAATSKAPKSEEIQEIEQYYKVYYNDEKIKFPADYPTGCLLGCVKLDECLPQEEYRTVYRNGESDSPYVFICSNAQELPVVLPIRGDHKIFDIERHIHLTACKALMRLKINKG